MTEAVLTRPSAPSPDVEQGFWELRENSFRVEVVICLNEIDNGEIPVFAPRLPAAVSHGRDEEEALSNIKEALAGLIKEHKESDERIPWGPDEPYELKEGEVRRSVLVDVD